MPSGTSPCSASEAEGWRHDRVHLPTVLLLAALFPGVGDAADTARRAEVPSGAAALHAQLIAKVQPSVRLWIAAQARTLRQAPGDEGAVRAAVQARFAGQSLGAGDIEAMAFVVLMQATSDMDQDLRELMAEVKVMTVAKGKLRELISKVNKDVANNAGENDMKPCVPLICGGHRKAMREAAAALGPPASRGTSPSASRRTSSNSGPLPAS